MTACLLAAVAVVIAASPASAHGVGSRSDLPLPVWQFAYGAGAAVLVSFAMLRTLWPRPRLMAASDGRPIAMAPVIRRAVFVLGRVVGLAGLALTLAAGWFGVTDSSDNIAPVAVFIVFWVGVTFVSLVAGDIWRLLNPIDSLAAAVSGGEARRPAPEGPWVTYVPAASVGIFVWLELAYHEPGSPRSIALWLTAHVAAFVVAAALWGRDWVQRHEGFTRLFALIGAAGPLYRRDDGSIGVRMPLSGLARIEAGRAEIALVLVVLGSTTFDGLSRTQFWLDIVSTETGWAATGYNTLGLAWVIGIVSIAYVGAAQMVGRIGGRDSTDMAGRFAMSLVPILVAYSVAHYFSLAVFEGQAAWFLLSDPLGKGWDLFGAADGSISYTALTIGQIAWTQVGAIVIGHIAGVVLAHDRAIEMFENRRLAERTQYPMLAVMVIYTVGGLALLLGA